MGAGQDGIGNLDDPDDVMIIESGISILDPRWHRTKDDVKKYVVPSGGLAQFMLR